MDEHPIQLIVTDDLRRNRWTVFFRIILVIPLLVVAALWSLLAIVAVIVSWLVTLLAGRTPDGLHGFLARYLRFMTQVSAYAFLAANPYPAFNGGRDYPVDLTIAPPAPQRRATVAVRILLALPAVFLASALVNLGSFAIGRTGGSGGSSGARYSSGGAIAAAAFLGWFVCVARGRMPRGLRDLQAYCLRYGAETWGYVLLLTDRYPNASPSDPAAAQPDVEPAVATEVTDDLRRSRLTVFFRLLLFLPHLVWIVLWTILVVPTAILAWLVMIVRGRLPAGLHRFFSAYVRYQAHVGAFLYLAASPFPGFVGAPGYPVDLHLPTVPEPQRRVRSAFRVFLVLPAWLISSALGTAALVASVLGWFASLVTGRMPRSLRDLVAWSIRYSGQSSSYLLFLTERYPYAGAYEFAPPMALPPAEPTSPGDPFGGGLTATV